MTGPKILSWDIETFPNVGDVWRLYDTTISLSQLRESSRVACFAAKWHHEKHVQFYSEYHQGHAAMVEMAFALLSEADVVVDYNGRRFDRLHMNKEFGIAGLGPAAPYQAVDLFVVVKQNFAFPNNKLEYVAQQFGIGSKEQTGGHELWVKCRDGDAKAWAKMEKYNKQDVVLTEKLYDKLLPWVKNHPNVQLYTGEYGCPTCGSDNLTKQGFHYTSTGQYQRYLCKECGRWSTSGKRIEGVDLR